MAVTVGPLLTAVGPAGPAAKGAAAKYYVYIDPGDGQVHAVNNRTGATDYTGSNTGVVMGSLLAAIGAATVTISFSDDTHVFAANVTIPTNVGVEGVKGTLFSINTGVVLTLNGPLHAGAFPLFTGAGTVVFGPDTILAVYPEWWGASGTASATTNTTAFTAMLACLAASAAGTNAQLVSSYSVNPIVLPDNLSNCSILGMGQSTGLKLATASGHVLSSLHGGHTKLELGRFSVDGADSGFAQVYSGIFLGSASPTGVVASTGVKIHDIDCNNVAYGVRVANCQNFAIDNTSGANYKNMVYAQQGCVGGQIDGVRGKCLNFTGQAVTIDGWQGGNGAPCSEIGIRNIDVVGAAGTFCLTSYKVQVSGVQAWDMSGNIGIDFEFCVDCSANDFAVGATVAGANLGLYGVWVRSSHRIAVGNGVVRHTSNSGVQVYGRSGSVTVTNVVASDSATGVGSPSFDGFHSYAAADPPPAGGTGDPADVLLVGNGGSIPASTTVVGTGITYVNCTSEMSFTSAFTCDTGMTSTFIGCKAIKSGIHGFVIQADKSQVIGCSSYAAGQGHVSFGWAFGLTLSGASYCRITDFRSDTDYAAPISIADGGGIHSTHNRFSGITAITAGVAGYVIGENDANQDYNRVEDVTTSGFGGSGLFALLGAHSLYLGHGDTGNSPAVIGHLLAGNYQNTAVTGSVTAYAAFGGAQATLNSTDSTLFTIPVPFTGTLRNLTVGFQGSQPGGGNLVAAIYHNGAATTLAVTANAGFVYASTTFQADTTHTVAVAAGDTICLQLANAAPSSSMVVRGYSVQLDPVYG